MSNKKTADIKAYQANYYKEYYAKNGDKIKAQHLELVKCKHCKINVKRGYLARHNRTKKHLANVEHTKSLKLADEAIFDLEHIIKEAARMRKLCKRAIRAQA